MKTVGVRELKNWLSEYIRQVRSGETVLVHLLGRVRLKAAEGHGGAATLTQRFGSAANLHIHLHCLVLAGVYRRRWRAELRRGGCAQRRRRAALCTAAFSTRG